MSFTKYAVAPILVACCSLGAQSAPPATPPEPPSVLHPATQPAADTRALLGPYFESAAAAIKFCPPAGLTREPRVIGGPNADRVAEFVDTVGKRKVTLTQMVFPDEVPLVTPKTGLQIGLLEQRTDALKETPGAEVLRSEPYSVGFKSADNTPDSGLIAVRYAAGTADVLTQEAIIQVSKYEYYLIDYTVPGSKAGSGTDHVSDEERAAADAFTAMINSVKLVDRTEIIQDQKERLYRTRFLFLNLTANRIRNALHDEQWLRIIKDGKDVGYSYVIEEEAEKNKRPGVNIGVRSRVVENGEQTDAESFFFVSFDRVAEDWTTVSQVAGKDPVTGKPTLRNATELGVSTRNDHKVLDAESQKLGLKDPKDKSNPPTLPASDYNLTVAYSGQQAAAPVDLQLPPFYLPQAMVHLIPRLVPLNEPKTYLVAVYVSDVRGVMRKYIDVGREGSFELDGKTIRAVPVTERLGLEGSATVHYMTRDGKYLGSVNDATHMMVLPTDSATLEKLWAKPDLSKPKRASGGSLTPGR